MSSEEIFERLFVAASVLFLSALSFFWFPGHHYLLEDAQVYVPILEHLRDPRILTHDLVATEPVLSLTIYGQAALFLRRVTGLDFQGALSLGQLAIRALGIWGVYLVARALKLSASWALLVAAVFSLGASVVGALTSTLESEPIPRAFSFPLVLLAVGLLAHGHELRASVAASVGLLFHSPAAWPFWVVYFCFAFWPSPAGKARNRLLGLVPLGAALMLLLLLALSDRRTSEVQVLFGRVDPSWEQLQRRVAGFVWVSTWPRRWVEHHVFLWVAAVMAGWRVRRWASDELRIFLFGLPLVGILSIPLTYLLQERTRWAFIEQLQPTRALIYVVAVLSIAGAAAGVRAVEQGKFAEGFLWFVLIFAIPAEPRVLHVLWPRLSDPLMVRRAFMVVLLASLACFAVHATTRQARGARLMLALAALLPFALLPTVGQVNRFSQLETETLDELAQWARTSTAADAVFLFPDADGQFYPGIFRARALRSVYVDRKSGGQAVYFRAFGEEWASRWQKAMEAPFDRGNLERYETLGIDYLVVERIDRVPGKTPVYENSRFVVYKLEN